MARPKTMETRKLVSLPADMSRAIEDYRFTNRIGSESEAIRRLIEAGLGKKAAAPSGSGSGGARKPRSTGKRA
jgi:Arc/MetJ-type ribon-helix-helix transcriptional regulator